MSLCRFVECTHPFPVLPQKRSASLYRANRCVLSRCLNAASVEFG